MEVRSGSLGSLLRPPKNFNLKAVYDQLLQLHPVEDKVKAATDQEVNTVYRYANDGKMLRVVRKRPYSPINIKELKKIQLPTVDPFSEKYPEPRPRPRLPPPVHSLGSRKFADFGAFPVKISKKQKFPHLPHRLQKIKTQEPNKTPDIKSISVLEIDQSFVHYSIRQRKFRGVLPKVASDKSIIHLSPRDTRRYMSSERVNQPSYVKQRILGKAGSVEGNKSARAGLVWTNAPNFGARRLKLRESSLNSSLYS